jgi:hypothetical protein
VSETLSGLDEIAAGLRNLAARLWCLSQPWDEWKGADIESHAAAMAHEVDRLRALVSVHASDDLAVKIEAALSLVQNEVKAFHDIPKIIGRKATAWFASAADSERCQNALNAAAAEVQAVGIVAGRDWLTHSEVLSVFNMNDGAKLTRLCNDKVIRCVGSRQDRRIDANSVAKYVIRRDGLQL